MKTKIYPEQFVLRVTREAGAYLDELMREGGYTSRAALMRSIIDHLMRDDLCAHGRRPPMLLDHPDGREAFGSQEGRA